MSKKTHSTWGGRFSEKPAELMVRFSESVSFDQRLAPYDIFCSKAHAAMLCKIGILKKSERDAIHKGLDAIALRVKKGQLKWSTKLDDVHMNIEAALLKYTPAAAKLQTARSRNDQVVTDMRLFFKDICKDIITVLTKLQVGLLQLAKVNQDICIPAYTHLQRAQPISLAHQLLAYIEMFNRDHMRFKIVIDHANVCPLGSGAVAGTTLPIDREFVAKYLDFVDTKGRPQLTQNSVDAVADRDLYIEFVTACALCGTHLSRIAEDFILWNSTEFNYVMLPDSFTTGSSLMPHKKNPDSLELIRGKSARIQGQLQILLTLVKGLPFSYNRDLQEDKRPVFDACDEILISLQVMEKTLTKIKVNRDVCAIAVADVNLLATDLVDFLVEKGAPFREAHRTVGRLVALAEKEGVMINELKTIHTRRIHKLLDGDWKNVFNTEYALNKRDKIGMPGPRQVRRQINRWNKKLGAH